jgi:perosamine synthetase
MTIALLGGTPVLGSAAHRSWPQLSDATQSAVQRVLERGVLSGAHAPESLALEAELAAFVQARYALLTHSGTSALQIATAAAGVGEGDHVLMPAYSFVATPLAVVQAGAIPIFVDIDIESGMLDARALRDSFTPRTRALMPVHIHGAAADMGPLLSLARDHGLAVIEDAAQAHGATWAGRPVGAIGTAGAFSLQSSKNLGVGEGGAFVTNDPHLAERANRIRNFGQSLRLADRSDYDPARPLDSSLGLESLEPGGMYRGNELTAAIARAALPQLPAATSRCQENAARLSAALRQLPGVLPPVIPHGSTSVHHKYRVRFDLERAGVELPARAFRDALMIALRAEGAEVVLWQSAALPAHPIFQERRGFGRGFPWSSDRDSDFAELYNPARFPRAQALLDSSLLLFSQSHPLIAQEAALVDRYAEAFARVWEQRHALCEWARSQPN